MLTRFYLKTPFCLDTTFRQGGSSRRRRRRSSRGPPWSSSGRTAPTHPWRPATTAPTPHFFTVQVGERLENISTSRLKPAHTADGPAMPPRRGRPPKAPAAAEGGMAANTAPSPGHRPPALPPPRKEKKVSFSSPLVLPAPPPADRSSPGTVFLPSHPGQVFARPAEGPASPQTGGRPQRHRRPPIHLSL